MSIAQLLQSGVTLEPPEATAIIQQLICGRGPRRVAAEVFPPFGPPTIENVHIGADGSVVCVGCEATFATSELAILLQAMLPPGQSIAGGLRYIIARGLLDVDAPPFDSVADLSQALARHESGRRADVVKRLYERAAIPLINRRRSDPAIAHLRRQLRDADARVYDQQLAIDALGAMTGRSRPSARPARSGRRLALAAGIAAGLVLVGAGDMMRVQYRSPLPTPPAITRAVEAPAVRPATLAPAGRIESRQLKRAAARSRAPERRARFGWLKTKFMLRADPL